MQPRIGGVAAGPGGQLGLEPVEGLPADLGLRRIDGRPVVLALAGGGQRGGAGGVVAVLGPPIGGELRVGLQRLGVEASRGGVFPGPVGEVGEEESLGVVGGLIGRR